MSCDHTRGWGPSGKAHCSSCCQSFSTVGNFDRHRAGSKDEDGRPGREQGVCHDPAVVGLVLGARGVWTQPGDDSRRADLARVLDAARGAK